MSKKYTVLPPFTTIVWVTYRRSRKTTQANWTQVLTFSKKYFSTKADVGRCKTELPIKWRRDIKKKIKTKKVNPYKTGFFLPPQHLDFGHVSYSTVTRPLLEPYGT